MVVNDLGGSLSGGDEGSAGPAETVAQEIRAAGGEAVSNSESVTSLTACQGMLQQALDAFGGLHAVINPAGILRDGMFHKMSEADWDSVIAVHLRGSFNVARATIEHFRDQNDGAYVFFTSTSGLFGNIGQTNYGAAKMGIVGPVADHRHGRRAQQRPLQRAGAGGLDPHDPIGAGEGRSRRPAPADHGDLDPPRPAGQAVGRAGSELAKNVTGQIFGASGDNLILYSQPRPIANLNKAEGWTPATIISEALPQMQDKFFDLNRAPIQAPRPATAPAS